LFMGGCMVHACVRAGGQLLDVLALRVDAWPKPGGSGRVPPPVLRPRGGLLPGGGAGHGVVLCAWWVVCKALALVCSWPHTPPPPPSLPTTTVMRVCRVCALHCLTSDYLLRRPSTVPAEGNLYSHCTITALLFEVRGMGRALEPDWALLLAGLFIRRVPSHPSLLTPTLTQGANAPAPIRSS
jgi:hypothetical protein